MPESLTGMVSKAAVMNIGVQKAEGNSVIYNADQINIGAEDKFQRLCREAEEKNPGLGPVLDVLRYMVDQDSLKKRLSDRESVYETLLRSLEGDPGSMETPVESLDDGYKSINTCICRFVFCFTLKEGRLAVKEDGRLWAERKDRELRFRYSEQVDTYPKYQEARQAAEETIKQLTPYLRNACEHGNVFQFDRIVLDEMENAPFLKQAIRFQVSEAIIPKLIRPLYGERPECGLREILQNAFDAVKEARQAREADPQEKVELWLLEEQGEKKVRVRDYGIGMTEEVLFNSYFVVGQTTKKGRGLGLAGQFGIGALAAFLLGDRVEVRTKPKGEDRIYHFAYEIPSEEAEGKNIDVFIEKDDGFRHGTEVVVTLKESLGNLQAWELGKRLKLDEWYIRSDIPVEYHEMGTVRKLRRIDGAEQDWRELETGNDQVKISYLSKGHEAGIILNGLLAPVPYRFSCPYLGVAPYIAVECYDDSVRMNLERSKVDSGMDIHLDHLQQRLKEAGLEELRKDRGKIVDSQGRIQRYGYDGQYLRNLPLFFTRDGFGIYSRETVERIPHEYIAEIYCSERTVRPKLGDLEKDILYVFRREVLDRRKVSELLEESMTLYFSNEILKPYFYDATSQYNGLKKEQMADMYAVLGRDRPDTDSANSFWEKHNREKEELFGEYFGEERIIAGGEAVSEEAAAIIDRFYAWAVSIWPKGSGRYQITGIDHAELS